MHVFGETAMLPTAQTSNTYTGQAVMLVNICFLLEPSLGGAAALINAVRGRHFTVQ